MGVKFWSMSFEEFGLLPGEWKKQVLAVDSEVFLKKELCAAVKNMGWQLPTDVQAECIPLILGGGDIMCASGLTSLLKIFFLLFFPFFV